MTRAKKLQRLHSEIAKVDEEMGQLRAAYRALKRKLRGLEAEARNVGGYLLRCSQEGCACTAFVLFQQNKPGSWWTDHDLDDDGVAEYLCPPCAAARGYAPLLEEGWSRCGKTRSQRRRERRRAAKFAQSPRF